MEEGSGEDDALDRRLELLHKDHKGDTKGHEEFSVKLCVFFVSFVKWI